jgi:hypothetical protein
MLECPVCLGTNVTQGGSWEVGWYACQKCGTFRAEVDARDELRGSLGARRWTPQARANLSHWLRQNLDTLLTRENLEGLAQLRTPPFRERLDAVLVMLARRSERLGAMATVSGPEAEGASATKDYDEAGYLVSVLQSTGLLEVSPASGGTFSARVTEKGWLRLDEIGSELAVSRLGFVAMDFARLGEDLWDQGIQPGVAAAGYDPVRTDSEHELGWAADESLAQIRRAKFVVADLSNSDWQICYQAGFATGLGLPVI